MSNLVDKLLASYELVLKEPWATSLSGKERVWFLVYDPSEQRKVDLRIGDFETAAKKAGKRVSASGNVYYESRPNRSDKDLRKKI